MAVAQDLPRRLRGHPASDCGDCQAAKCPPPDPGLLLISAVAPGDPSVFSALKIREQGIELIAPVNRSRLGDDVTGRALFVFDDEGRVVRCPVGHAPVDHRVLSGNNTKRRSLHAIFDGDIRRACDMLDRCPVRAPNHRAKGCSPRDTSGDFRLEVTAELRLRDEMYALHQTAQWRERYRIRAGIEATNSELKRAHGIGRLRVRRLAKVCFAVACKIIACNIKRWARAHAALMKLLQYLMSVASCPVKLPDTVMATYCRRTPLFLTGTRYMDRVMR